MHKKIVSSLYFQVILAITIGICLGHVYPSLGADMKPLGDGFVKLIKMIIAPVIFCTVVTGIAGMESMKAVGKTGAIALIYFEVVSTLALIIGLCVVNVLQPGAGMNVDPSSLDASAISVYADQAQSQGIIPFLLDVIPASVIGAFAGGNILQVFVCRPVRIFPASYRGEGKTHLQYHRWFLSGYFRHHQHDHETGADRGIWCHGIHHREIRYWFFGSAGAINC